MDFILDAVAYRIGVYVPGLLSGGCFKGESGFAWGWAVAVGGLIPLSLFAAFVAWLIYTRCNGLHLKTPKPAIKTLFDQE
ncbi:hypothetical protein J2W17_005563 [Pseudomonas lini]|uniref:hypothetical protein n=1 Tax=Pseudomonas lini TaxID=163011 RepID=UPI002780EE55|nr:hypothetical protein [Pseudomonas lini]MDQ0126577.1 hypothetical protein [Pseudomonas lini]